MTGGSLNFYTKPPRVPVLRAPGFVSPGLHRATDGTKVTMYAQRRSIDEYRRCDRGPSPRQFLEEALKIAKFEPGIYEVVRTFTHPPASRIETMRLRPLCRHERTFHNRASRLRSMQLSRPPPRPPLAHYLNPSSGSSPEQPCVNRRPA